MIHNIDAKTLAQWQTSDDAFIVDVREPEEFANGHIQNARNIPLSYIEKHVLPKPGKKKLVVHCAVGARSMQAIQYWQQYYTDLEFYNLADSIRNWESAGLALESSKI